MAKDKITIDKLGEMTRDEFGRLREEMATKGMMRDLNEKIDDGFIRIRSEMQENTRAILGGHRDRRVYKIAHPD